MSGGRYYFDLNIIYIEVKNMHSTDRILHTKAIRDRSYQTHASSLTCHTIMIGNANLLIPSRVAHRGVLYNGRFHRFFPLP